MAEVHWHCIPTAFNRCTKYLSLEKNGDLEGNSNLSSASVPAAIPGNEPVLLDMSWVGFSRLVSVPKHLWECKLDIVLNIIPVFRDTRYLYNMAPDIQADSFGWE